MVTDTARHSRLPPGTQCPRCNYEIGVPDAAACPERGLAVRDIQGALKARARAHRQWIFLASANSFLPIAGLVLVSFVCYLFTQKDPPGFVAFIVVVWMIACVSTFIASIFAGSHVRGVWCCTYLKILPILGAVFVVVPVNWLLSPLGTGMLFWAALACTMIAIAVSNVLAWRARRTARERLMLPSGIGAAAFLLFHIVLATVFGAIALMSVIGDRIFVLPGQQ